MNVTRIPKKTISVIEPKRSLIVNKEQYHQRRVAAYLTLGSGGKVVLHTKTDVEIGDEENECNQDTKENNIGY